MTDEQVLEELFAVASAPVAAAIRKGLEIDGGKRLPITAIQKDLRLVPVRGWKRLPAAGETP